jgi:large subunit ribosomal protein L28
MSRQCAICEKKTITGRQISHAHNVTSRTWAPNLQRLRIVIDGTTRREWVCTRCIRSGKVEKPPQRTWETPDAEAPQA